MSSNITLLADGFDDAIIGISHTEVVPRVVYSVKLMVNILCNRDEMSEDDAIEFLYFNVFEAYLGEGTPIYVDVMDAEAITNYNFD
jgi:hypothetical protein